MKNKTLVIILSIVGVLALCGVVIGVFLIVGANAVKTSVDNATKTTSTTTPTVDVSTSTYKNNSFGFSFNYPKDWTIDTDSNKTGETSGLLVHLFSDKVVDNFKNNFNIAVSPNYTSTGDIFTFVDSYIQTFSARDTVKDYTLISKEKITLGGKEAAKITYTATLQGVSLKQTQYFVVNGTNFYFLTYTGTPVSYEQNTNEFNALITSFKF